MVAVSAKDELLSVLREELPRLEREFGVERIAVFGSFAKGHPSEASDVDILVQLKEPLGLDFVRLARILEEKLGRKVDLATFESLQRSKSNRRQMRMAADVERTLVYV